MEKKLHFLYSVFENKKILVIENSSSENKSIGNCTKIVVNLRQFTLRETCPNTELFLFRIFLSLD